MQVRARSHLRKGLRGRAPSVLGRGTASQKESAKRSNRPLTTHAPSCKIFLAAGFHYIHDTNSTAAFLESIVFSIRPQGSVFSLRDTVHTQQSGHSLRQWFTRSQGAHMPANSMDEQV